MAIPLIAAGLAGLGIGARAALSTFVRQGAKAAGKQAVKKPGTVKNAFTKPAPPLEKGAFKVPEAIRLPVSTRRNIAAGNLRRVRRQGRWKINETPKMQQARIQNAGVDNAKRIGGWINNHRLEMGMTMAFPLGWEAEEQLYDKPIEMAIESYDKGRLSGLKSAPPASKKKRGAAGYTEQKSDLRQMWADHYDSGIDVSEYGRVPYSIAQNKQERQNLAYNLYGVEPDRLNAVRRPTGARSGAAHLGSPTGGLFNIHKNYGPAKLGKSSYDEQEGILNNDGYISKKLSDRIEATEGMYNLMSERDWILGDTHRPGGKQPSIWHPSRKKDFADTFGTRRKGLGPIYPTEDNIERASKGHYRNQYKKSVVERQQSDGESATQ